METSNSYLSYATAIFSMSSDNKTLEKYYQQISSLDSIVDNNQDLAKILSSRSINKNERKELAKSILLEFGFDSNVIFWVWTIIDNNMFSNYHSIANACRDVYLDLFDIKRVKITSAKKLTDAQIDLIKKFFEQKFEKRIFIENEINPSLIGGLKISINNKTYNNTLKNKLESLKNNLLSKKG